MKKLIEKRKKMKLTQHQVAVGAGISRQYYNAIETGKRIPKVGTAKKIANVLGVDWTIFFAA